LFGPYYPHSERSFCFSRPATAACVTTQGGPPPWIRDMGVSPSSKSWLRFFFFRSTGPMLLTMTVLGHSQASSVFFCVPSSGAFPFHLSNSTPVFIFPFRLDHVSLFFFEFCFGALPFGLPQFIFVHLSRWLSLFLRCLFFSELLPSY